MVIAGKESKENLQEVANILKTTNNPQVNIDYPILLINRLNTF